MSRYNITYSGVLAAVNANPQLSHFSPGNSLLAVVPLGFLSYAGFNYNTYLSGETKNATSTIPKGLLTAVTVALIGIAGLAAASYAAMGGSFIGGMSYLFNSGHLSGLPVQPSINFLVSLATPPWLGFLINLNITVGFFLVALSFTISYSRLIFGMAFDRVLPMKIADVSERFHSPAWALVFVTILSFIFTTVWWYTGWASS